MTAAILGLSDAALGALVGLSAAAIGAFAGLGGALVSSRAQLREATLRHHAELAVERERESRLAVANLASCVARALQAMDWFTWEAAKPNPSLDSAGVAEYDNTIREQFPNVMEAMAKVAALSADGFVRFNPLVQAMFDLDKKIAVAAASIAVDRDESLRHIATFDHESDKLFKRFNGALADWANTRTDAA